MTLLSILELFNYGLVLLFGLFLSTFMAGGWENQKQRKLILILCPLFLMVQGLCFFTLGVRAVEQLYPLIVHLPLILILVFALKKRFGVALVSVCTAYLLCQLPFWADLSISALTGAPLAGQIGYTIIVIPLFFLLYHYFVRTAYDAMTYSSQSLWLFGGLPLIYYLFDYATTVYSSALYANSKALIEFLPTILIVFYILFLSAYHTQTQFRLESQLKNSRLEAELKHSRTEMDALRHAETQMAIYQHDMRHHLSMIGSYLSADKPDQAFAYIQKVEDAVAAITPKHFCENEAVNLLCSAFSDRARRLDIHFTVNVKLPKTLSISDTELCSLLSNGLENALHATSSVDVSDKRISLFCGIRFNKLLIEIKNPYVGEILMQDGIPVSKQQGHGFGCRSIHTISERLHGLCTFEPTHGLFTLRVVLPL